MASSNTNIPAAIGVTIGGTFTDIVYFQPTKGMYMHKGELRVHKLPNIPEKPARGLAVAAF